MNTPRCSGPVSRRKFLEVGSLAASGVSLSSLLRHRAHAAETRGSSFTPDADTSVIFIWLPGGAPHTETYDMKPDAPLEYRGEFNPIHTNVPGLDVCEHLPLHAAMADKYNIVRSVAHNFADHGGGHKRFLTGRIPASPVDTVNDNPMVGSIVAKCRERKSVGVPNYVSGTDPGRDGVDVFAFGPAYLGQQYGPFSVAGDPSSDKFEVRNLGIDKAMSDRLDDRTQLLAGLDHLQRQVDRSGAMDAMDSFNRRAFEILTSSKCREAFDLKKEPQELRDRYGMHAWGQRCMLARRLVEAGCSFVTMVLENPYQSGVPFLKQGVYNWDSHSVNCHMYDDLRARLPIYDKCITALIEDLYNRGLDKKVMLVVTGEFGRTPRVNPAIGTQTGVMQPGRDHWPQAMSFLVSGGAMRTGQVIGSTNAKAEHPQDRPMTPNNLWASVYRHLGIDYTNTFPDRRGRPMPILPFGEPIDELLRVS